jgi:hypothetical protein
MNFWVGLGTALILALIIPFALHGGFGLLGYDHLATWLPWIANSLALAVVVELILYLVISLLAFLIYHRFKKINLSDLGWFFLGNIAGYVIVCLMVALAVSAWHGPAL